VTVLAASLAATVIAAPVAVGANPEGQLDTAFSADGKWNLLVGATTFALDSLVQPDGKLVIVGSTGDGLGTSQAILVRLTATGALDTTFGGDGIVQTLVDEDSTAEAVALQPDGKLVVVLSTNIGGTSFYSVARYTASGALDTTFSGDGLVEVRDAVDRIFLSDVAIAPDGQIVIAGSQFFDDLVGAGGVFVGRLTGTGAWDTSFNTTGRREITTLAVWATANAVRVLPDGRVLYAGNMGNGLPVIGQLTASGQPDTSFGGDGLREAPYGDVDGTFEEVLLTPDGRIVVTGMFLADGLVARFTSAGEADASFGANGRLLLDPTNQNARHLVPALEPNGRIVVAAEASTDMWVARVLSNGVLDPTFGTAGFTSAGIGEEYDTPVGVGITSTGRILVGLNLQRVDPNELGVMAFTGDKTPPFDARVTNAPATATSRSATLQWIASDDNTGIRRYDLRYRSAAYNASTLGSATTWKTDTTSSYGAFTGSAGRTYCFEARGEDRAGNTGSWGPRSCMAIPVNDRSLSRSGTWSSVSSSGYYLGTASRSTSSGAKLTLSSVKYRRLAIVATKCSGCGTVKVYLGSSTTPLATISLSASSTRRRQVITVDVSAALKSGTITIRQSSGGKPVIIEGLAVGLY
jgi:uncharacterized delta-60 repeat protein